MKTKETFRAQIRPTLGNTHQHGHLKVMRPGCADCWLEVFQRMSLVIEFCCVFTA